MTERTPIRRLIPVDDYLKAQKRFAHLFQPGADPQWRAAIQKIAERNIQEFGLLQHETPDALFGCSDLA